MNNEAQPTAQEGMIISENWTPEERILVVLAYTDHVKHLEVGGHPTRTHTTITIEKILTGPVENLELARQEKGWLHPYVEMLLPENLKQNHSLQNSIAKIG